MYNTKHECLYLSEEVFKNVVDITEKIMDITEDEKAYIQNTMYREDILEIFDVEEFDDEKINIAIHEVYEKVKMNDDLRNIMQLLSAKVLSSDEEIGFTIMFSFDYLYLSHSCISEYLETGNVSKEKITQFIKNI